MPERSRPTLRLPEEYRNVIEAHREALGATSWPKFLQRVLNIPPEVLSQWVRAYEAAHPGLALSDVDANSKA